MFTLSIPVVLIVKRKIWFAKEYSANYTCFYIESHSQTKTANMEHIFPNPILHDISPPLTLVL